MLGGGGGHSPQILVGMCHGKVKNGGLWSESSVKMRGSGAGSSVEIQGSGAGSSVKWGSLELTCKTRLAGTLAGCNPGALRECFAYGLAVVNRPWAATERLEGK